MPNFHDFSKVATLPPKRTKTDGLSYPKQTTLSQGDLRPVYFQEVLPGTILSLEDGISIKNIPTPLHAVSDDAYLDINFFFVPRRLLWRHWEAFIGADAVPDAYTDPVSYVEPTMTSRASQGAAPAFGSVINNLGVGLIGESSDLPDISPFPAAGFALIWNEFYRDENLQDENPFPAIVYELSSGASLTLNSSDHGWLLKNTQTAFNSVNKYHDMFTSLLPKPYKNDDPISLPLGVAAPITASSTPSASFGLSFKNAGEETITDEAPVLVKAAVGNTVAAGADFSDFQADDGNGNMQRIVPQLNVSTLGGLMSADLTNATAATINDLRLAFAAQAYLEALARGGSRYTELLHQFFGVNPTDARLQRPEFLGTIHKRLNFTSVASTNGNTSTSSSSSQRPTGSLGGYSVTGINQKVFFKQIEEHGYVYGLASIRVMHKYGQGIPKVFLKKDRFDYYNKFFDRIGEVPVKTKEIYSGYSSTDTLGFQEAWYEYKMHPAEVSGLVSPNSTTDLVAWNYADKLPSAPTLSSDFIRETRANIDKTLIGVSSSVPQYLLDIYHQVEAVIPMSTNSVPAGIGF